MPGRPRLVGPRADVPARRPGSVRRSSSLDIVPGGEGSLELRGRARDLVTSAGGDVHVAATGLLRLVVDPQGRVVLACGHPSDPSGLVGRGVRAGFRTAVWRTLRADYDAGSPLHQLLDDVAGAMVISGFTARRVQARASGVASLPPTRRRVDVCVGWAAGSDAVRRLEQEGRPPPPVFNPPVAAEVSPDPVAVHSRAPLAPMTMRRARRLDVWAEEGGLVADVGFRDTFADDDGVERVLHEFSLDVRVDAEGRVSTCDPTPHVLPHVECPLAVLSAQRVVGRQVAGLREGVSMDFFGPTTCTHLNDVLRGLTDLPRLAELLAP